MSLLTSDKSSRIHFLVSLVSQYSSHISLLFYVSGILTSAVLISEWWCEKTYFSDNALLPGLVNREFTLTSQSETLLKSLQDESSRSEGAIPSAWIESQFRQIGLEVYQQNFTLNYPFGSKPKFTGRNIYAIFRAPRAPSTEALVLSTPFRSDDNPHGSTLPSVFLMISLAEYFSSKNYWAKDVIFLISEHELVGMQAWLNAYHNVRTSGVLEHSPFVGVSGPIQAAVNLELHSAQMSRIDIKIEGLNGQLPNLDLFNVAVELCTRESVTPTFQGSSHPYSGAEFDIWKQYAATTLSMMLVQGISLPTGAHGLFQKFGIQAITLEGIERKPSNSEKQYVPVKLLHVGRVIEGVFRSLNNLLERFNRSYWFYLLPSTRRYLSIGYYMIPFALITTPLLLTALQGYLFLRCDSQQTGERPAGHTGDQIQQPVEAAEPPTGLEEGIPFCFFAHVLGLILLSVPFIIEQHVSGIYKSGNLSTESLIYSAILSFSALLILTPIFKPSDKSRFPRQVIGLLNAALLLCCISLINISLALALSLIHSPVMSVVGKAGPQRSRLKSMSGKLALLFIHPVSINYFCLWGMSFYLYPDISLSEHFSRAFEAQKRTILLFIEDWYIYGNWTYLLASAFLFPVWLQAWHFA